MERVIRQLKKWLIISLQDIRHLKAKIAIEYPENERPAKLASTIHDHIDTHLSGLTEREKQYLKHQLIKKTLLQKQSDISRLDILETISEHAQLSKSERLKLTKDWLTSNTEYNLSDFEIESLLTIVSDSETLDNILSQSPLATYTQFQSEESQSNNILNRLILLMRLRLKTLPIKPFIFLNVLALLILIYLGISHLTLPNHFSEVQQTITIHRTEPLGLTPFIDNQIRLIKQVKIIDHTVIALTYRSFYFIKTDDTTYSYMPVDYLALRNYLLLERNSFLVNDTYLNEIILLARHNDIDPLLLLAIIGQEQGFVPISSEAHQTIVNNPYNVFSSWQNYNTNLTDATKIAIGLIKNRLEEKPNDVLAFKWLNIIYAEDPNWSEGVSLIYDSLTRLCRTGTYFVYQ